jgi:hypothetical protein
MTRDLDRFSSRERLEKWRQDREILCLVDARGSLLGIVWVGEKPMPQRSDYLDTDLMRRRGPRLTWAIRLYGAARGFGLSIDFAECALANLLSGRRGRSSSLWHQTKAKNIAARSLARHLGFFEASGEEGGTVIGVRFGR